MERKDSSNVPDAAPEKLTDEQLMKQELGRQEAGNFIMGILEIGNKAKPAQAPKRKPVELTKE